jgi:hypothetical protein
VAAFLLNVTLVLRLVNVRIAGGKNAAAGWLQRVVSALTSRDPWVVLSLGILELSMNEKGDGGTCNKSRSPIVQVFFLCCY